ncbi:MAG: hypothetical protein A3J24_04600 [Deltaproteobacteria bacterium RIFCSPLOWO2_02_FULL_53_8]|nr:MAG: hypothetical protein A3J24_04600 [Deltaproteobacteria bacterium RIFCSPLOWO2_02_FULL_53_8]
MKLRILVAYSMVQTFNQATLTYLNSFKQYFDADVEYLHVTDGSKINVTLNSYDVVIQSYCARLCFDGYVAADFIEKLRGFDGLKILSVQDEYNRTNVLKDAIKYIGFDIVLTCVPQHSLRYVYSQIDFPRIRFETVLTGYASESIGEFETTFKPIRNRSVVVGYRGRNIGGIYGQLGFDKYEIGRRMKEICAQRGISHDIAMDEESRIYGAGWFDFIGSCRAMLGSESGSNVFDFDGSLESQFRDMATRLGREPSYSDFLPLVAQRDSEISMGQISPRIFECALMRTPMVLFRGEYSGVIKQGVHYIMLEKNFSNVDDVLDQLEQIDELEAMATRTYDHLIASEKFGYRAFIRNLEEIILEEMNRRSTAPRKSGDLRNNKLEEEIPFWQLQTPSKAPKLPVEYQLIEKKKNFIYYRDEIQNLEQLKDDTLRRYREACTIFSENRSSGSDKSDIENFRRFLKDMKRQFDFFQHERLAVNDLVIDFANIVSLAKIDRLVDIFEKQTKELYLLYEQAQRIYAALETYQPSSVGQSWKSIPFGVCKSLGRKLQNFFDHSQ